MKIRRIAAALLALLIFCLPFAGAETTLLSSHTMDLSILTISRSGNVLIGQANYNAPYALYNPDGTRITSELYHTMDACGNMFKVGVESGLNIYGLIDETGAQVMPMQYADIESFSDRWTMGVVLAKATVDNYDYKSYDGENFYLVSNYDIYFDGVKVGTLARTAYKYAYAYGAYLYVQDAESNYTYYNSQMIPSGYTTDYPGSSEFEEVKNDVWHRGSNQKAFCAGCTLTSDDVVLDVYVVDGRIVDLQGNELGVVDSKYDYIDKFKGDYARVKMNGLYGLIDRAGNEIIACEYDEIPYGDKYFEGDYQPVVKGGKFGYVNKNGEVTCDFVYSADAVKSIYRMPFTTVADLTGNFIVLSGAAGELPEKYADVRVSTRNGSPLLVVENAEGNAGVIDLYGNEVIPMDGTYDDGYDLSISADGTLVLGTTYVDERAYQIYTFSHDAQAQEAPAAEEAPAEQTASVPAAQGVNSVARPAPGKIGASETAEQAPAEENANPNAWTCVCGSANTGKFCPECGTAKPAGCPGCGAEVSDTAKFCSECGASLKAE